MARKLRAVLPDLGLKGEKAVVTEVRYLVSILGGCCDLCRCIMWLLEVIAKKSRCCSRRCGLRSWRWRSCGRIGKAATAIDGGHRFHMTSTLIDHTPFYGV
jgi:hypothetical protein